ncbi:MAG: aryl-sulfate sulfotransferase [Bacteriovorax sp.]|nr:aryl-sulfate sulfotransferase [Bacteriovorax sp.]
MNLRLLLFVALLLQMLTSCSSVFYRQKSKDLDLINSLQSHKEYFIQIYCKIFDFNGILVREYPGSKCVFNDDGTFMMTSNNDKEIGFYNQNASAQWKLPLHTHHQLNKNAEGNYLVMSSTVKRYLNTRMRFDKLIIMNDQGNILNYYDLAEHIDLVEKNKTIPKKLTNSFAWDKETGLEAESEVSHANSFYQIPSNPKSSEMVFLREKNYISSNTFCNCAIVFSSDLSKIEKIISLKDNYIIHDFQILPNGNLLGYFNSSLGNHSIIEQTYIGEFDLTSDKYIFRFTPNNHFFSRYTGGVQKFMERLYIYNDYSDSDPKATIINDEGEILKVIRFKALDNKDGFQQAKIIKLDLFLKNNYGI